MRIAVLVVLAEQQHALLTHELDDRIVRVKHALPREVFDFRRETTRVVDWAIDLESVAFADDEVVVTVARRGVYSARAGLLVRLLLRFADVELRLRVSFTAERNVLANHQQRRSIEPRMARFEPIELRTRETREHLQIRPKSALRRHCFDQFTRTDENLVTIFKRRVLKIRMHRDA